MNIPQIVNTTYPKSSAEYWIHIIDYYVGNSQYDHGLASVSMALKHIVVNSTTLTRLLSSSIFNYRPELKLAFIGEDLHTFSQSFDELANVIFSEVPKEAINEWLNKFLDPHARELSIDLMLIKTALVFESWTAADQLFLNSSIYHNKSFPLLKLGALIAFKKGELLRSIELASQALSAVKNDQDKAEVHSFIADAKLRSMDAAGALEEIKSGLLIQPGDTTLLKMGYSYAHYADGNLSKEARYYALQLAATLEPKAPNQNIRNKSHKTSKRELRVGFISSGYRVHPVGWMMAGLLAELKTLIGLKPVIFDLLPGTDFIAKTIQELSGEYHDLKNRRDEEILLCIKNSNLDVLVDLEGYQPKNVLSVIAQRPAPVIVKWIGGLVGSTHLPYFDYLITDSTQTPIDLQCDFSERLIVMQSSYVTYTPPPYRILQDDKKFELEITFGYANNAIKITPTTLKTWSRILNGIPNSTLALKDRLLELPDNKNKIIKMMGKEGIDERRLHFFGGTSHQEHLDFYNRIHIALDPIPYSGGLCTLEAASMGVPVIALAGRLLCHRHSVSHLSSIGHPELIANSIDEYIWIATNLAGSPERLEKYFHSLRSDLMNSSLLNHKAFAQEFVEKIRAITR